MNLIVRSTANTAVQMDSLGITIPANGLYDVEYLLRHLGKSTEFMDAIGDGTLAVIEDIDPESYYTVQDAIALITYGVNRNALGLGNSAGYLQLASGTTAQRPSPPAGGMSRFNTDTGLVEMYMNGDWQNLPQLHGTEFRADDSAVLYRKTADNKFLSVSFASLIFSHSNTADLSWIYIDSNITSSLAGYNSPFYGTIVYVGAYTDKASAVKSLSCYVNSTEHEEVVSFGGAETSNSVITSIDFSPGDTVRFRVRSNQNGKLGAVYITLFFCLRDPT